MNSSPKEVISKSSGVKGRKSVFIATRPAGLEPATLDLEVGFFQTTKVSDIIGICSLDKALTALSRFNRRPQIYPETHQKLHPKLQFCCNLFKDDLDGRNDRIAGR